MVVRGQTDDALRAQVPMGSDGYRLLGQPPEVVVVRNHGGLAVGERLERDPVVGLAHAELYAAAPAAFEPRGRAALALDGQLEVGDRAVDGVVLGAVGVGVDPADEVLRGARDAARGP